MGKAQHSVSKQNTSGEETASHVTEGTSSYSVSQFCSVKGDLQAVIEMPKDIGNTGYISTTVLNVTTALNLQG